MSDYINNLIARNQPTAEVVRPRLPSIFEPPAVAAPAFLNARLAEDETPEAEALIEAQITKRQSPVVQPPAWRGLQQLPEKRAEFRETTVLPLDTEPLTTPPVVTPPVHIPQADIAAHREARRSRPVFAQTNQDKESAERHESKRPQADDSQPSPPASLPGRGVTYEVVTRRIIERAENRTSSVDSDDHHKVVGPLITRRNENYTRRDAPRSDQPPPDQPHEPPAPVINVTIGRIEVKAMPPATAPPRPRQSAAPLMSLDEYMRRRKTGGDSV